MSAVSEAVRAVLEAPIDPPTVRPGIPPRRPGKPPSQRGRTGSAAGPWDAGKHPRGAGGEFAKTQQQQAQLKQQGMYQGKVDGIAGPKTREAIKAFQAKYGLRQTGNVDEATKATLAAPPPKTAGQVAHDEAAAELASQPKSRRSGSGSGSGSKEDQAGFNWRTQGNGKRGVTLKDGSTKVVSGDEYDQLRERGEIDEAKTPKLNGDTPGKSSSGSSSGSGRSASAGSSSTAGGVLRQGAGMDRKRGLPQVKQTQTLLQDLGYDLGEPGADGKFGPITSKAVKAFQREHGLRADGVIGRHTLRLLNMIKSKRSSATGNANAPLSLDEESLAGRKTAEAALLVLEAPGSEPCTQEERKQLWERFPFVAPKDGSTGGGVSLKRDKGGLFVHTHRARSKSYPSVSKLPETAVRFIESTG